MKAGQRIVDLPVAAAFFAALCNTRLDSVTPTAQPPSITDHNEAHRPQVPFRTRG